MSKLALGLIETIGLAAAVEAADAAVKSANITLIGYELSKGGGLVTVKLEGDVGAVKAAVEAGAAAAERVNKIWGKQVIPRPHEELDSIIFNRDTVGTERIPELPEIYEAAETEAEIDVAEKMQEAVPGADKQEKETEESEEADVPDPEPEKADELEDGDRDYCNLCLDPLCTRKKGELRSTCIHYAD